MKNVGKIILLVLCASLIALGVLGLRKPKAKAKEA